MTIKTTINIKHDLLDRVKSAARTYDLSLSALINMLIRKTFQYTNFKIKLLQTVQYQDRIGEDDTWHNQHVSFECDIYEKSQDMRRLFKFSVSFLVAFAIKKYLDVLIDELKQGKQSDNYYCNILIFSTHIGFFRQITILWEMVENKRIEKIKKNHIIAKT